MSQSELRHLILGNFGEGDYLSSISDVKSLWSATKRYDLVDAVDNGEVDEAEELIDELKTAVDDMATMLKNRYEGTMFEVNEAEAYQCADDAFDEAHGSEYLKKTLGAEVYTKLIYG